MMASNSSSQTTCQNCTTSTTPLWRRDEFGSVLCNACGLFLKLHNRPRPISLKTDVIKSRNRVKAVRPDMAASRRKQNAATAAQAFQRATQKPANGNLNNDSSDSPISRTDTPSMYNQGLPAFMADDGYNGGFATATGPDGGAGSPTNGDLPQTHEQLMAVNSGLRTRVSELEVINELFRGRLTQLEQQEATARHGHEVAGEEQTHLRAELEIYKENEAQLRMQLEESHRREKLLQDRLDELEMERNPEQTTSGAWGASPERAVKRVRLDTDVAADAAAALRELDPELGVFDGGEAEVGAEPEHQQEHQQEPETEQQAEFNGELEVQADPEGPAEAEVKAEAETQAEAYVEPQQDPALDPRLEQTSTDATAAEPGLDC